MNVIVYAGSEVDQKSLNGTLGLLRSLCLPHYTVQVLSKASFIKDPWEIGCALFVLPSLVSGHTGSDIEIFGPQEVQRLRGYVEQAGGAFLGFSLGARVEEHRSLKTSLGNLSLGFDGGSYIKDEDIRVPLRFLDATSRTYVYPISGKNIEMISLGGKPPVMVQATDATFPASEGRSKDFEAIEKIPSGTLVGHLSVGKGHMTLARVQLESDDAALQPLLRSILESLKLQLPSASLAASSRDLSPLPQFLSSIPPRLGQQTKPIVSILLRPFFPRASASDTLSGSVKDIEDNFNFLSLKSEWVQDLIAGKKTPIPKTEKDKDIIFCPDGVLPPKNFTPRFDHQLYYDTLRNLKGPDQNPRQWGFGEALLYSERVTSTQSMFDKNPVILSQLPTPVLSIAAQQLAGRGRGKNVWLSPEGCLMMSLLVRVDLDPGGRSSRSASTKTGETSKTSAAGSTGGTKTTKTVDVEQPTKTTKKESDAAPTKTAKTTASGDSGNLKTTAAGSGDSLKTAENKTAATKTTGSTTSTDGPTKIAQTKTTANAAPGTLEQSEELTSANPIPILAASKLVFIQYLFALAVCEACRLPEVLGPELGKKVRIKWPNDLYLDISEPGSSGTNNLKKIGGILVNTNFAPGGKVDVVIGCGLNVLNAPPISSLSQLVSKIQATSTSAPTLSMERTAAAIVSTFETLWTRFTSAHGSFEPFLSAYYGVWLHTDQRVTITTTVPPTSTRIVGITPDYGLLRTVRDDGESRAGTSYGRYVYSAYEGGKEYIDLQPDGNSFDLMANLIKAKTT